MAQDVGQQGYQPEGTGERDPEKRSGVWPWVALAVVVMVVLLLLWLFWRQAQQPQVESVSKTSKIIVVAPQVRPEPIVPAPATDSAETTVGRLAPDVSGDSQSSGVSTPVTRDVKMPQVVGLTQASAESKVKAAGLVPYLTYGNSGIPDGHVISQWPLAGVMVPSGSEGLIQVQLNP